MNYAVYVSNWMVESFAVSRMKLFKGRYERLTFCRRASITPLTISEVVQEKGEYLHQPICRQFGKNRLI